MKRAVFFILNIFREIALKMAITLLILAAIWGVFSYFLSNVCISGYGTYSQACIDGAAALDKSGTSKRINNSN
jgi:hypothetical protein